MGTGRQVLVLGYGEMGHAMQQLLGPHHALQFWDIRPLPDMPVVELDTAVPQADTVLYCVPVTPLAGLVARVVPLLAPGSISISIAKGLDADGRTAAQVLAEGCGSMHPYSVLYGPMIAEEIRAGRPAFAQLAASTPDCSSYVQDLFAGSALALEPCTDMHGMAWSSVLKNVYAMLIGVADELQLGDNVRGYLVVAALREMQAIVPAMGGAAGTAQQLAGLGDLVTTATSAGSHHHELGRQLARGERGLSGEGIHTLAMLRRYVLFDVRACPLVQLMQQIVATPEHACRLLRQALPGSAPA